ncbi:head-to-tail adaptor [Gordonia phage Hexbug]|nr:head-to-tail adaptor [Gordonia phage Orla]UVK62925.1 head-to-tail adaptor [Gordonia phage Hexbug]WNN96102.1 head-to-tail adaptor [Gordonia phage Nodigi]
MDPIIKPDDVIPFVKVPELLGESKAQEMVDVAIARARLLAPCLADDYEGDPLSEDELVVVRDTIRDAIVRWADGGRGIVTTEAKGEYSQSIRQTNSLGLFRPNEIRELQSICKGAKRRGKASTTVVGFPYGYGDEPNHAAWCSWQYDGRNHNVCDCGAILTASGDPLY